MTRLRRIALTILVGVLVTLPTAGSALANIDGGLVIGISKIAINTSA
jgi:hypothetical protein